MKKLRKILILGLLIIISLTGAIGCNSLENEFGLEQFENKMKEKGYEYEIRDSDDNLLGPICHNMILDDNVIIDGTQFILYDTWLYIYSYKNNEQMEKKVSILNKDASEINSDGYPLEWLKTPHFYKKGTIIVRYNGDDKKVITDLKEIMGEQFAGR